jgi:hypothetical protein
MSETKIYKNAIPQGPGGIHCQCCAPRETVKASRIAINRAYRRKVKITDKKEVDSTLTEEPS